MVEKKKIALLFFSRSAAAEGREKAWFSVGTSTKNQTLAASLVRHTHQVLKQSGLPVFHFHEGNQCGQTFGERLANAYQQIFDLGYEGVIAVGNDTPELDRIDWKELCAALAAGECLIGPTFRQGAYLIGITADAFDQQDFAALPWQSGRLLQRLIHFCTTSKVKPVLLTTLRDVNTRADLKKLTKNALVDHPLGILIRQLLTAVKEILIKRSIALRLSLYLLGHAHFRAPPKPYPIDFFS